MGRVRRWFTTGWTLTRAVTLAVGGLIGFIVLLFVIAFFMGMTSDAAEAANRMSYIRDLVTIVLTVTGILIIAGIGILIIQIARFVNLLRSEVKPITDDAKQSLQTARATTEFVSKHAVEPVILTQTFFAGLFTFLREIIRLSRLLKRQNTETKGTPDDREG
jgi:TRAP-type C4-dicarboxylate transport system permease small subunit